MKIKFFLLFTIFITQLFPAFGQKNEIEVFFTPQLTRTYFDEYIDKYQNGTQKIITFGYDAKYPVIGNSFGIRYARKFGKYYAGIVLKQNLRGQRSSFNYYYKDDSPSDTFPGYEGSYYHFMLKSLGLSLSISKNIILKEHFESRITLGAGMDLYQYAFTQNYGLLSLYGGILSFGSTRLGYYHSDNYFKNIKAQLKERNYRLEFFFSMENVFTLYKNLKLSLSPELYYVTDFFDQKHPFSQFVPYGRVISAGLKTGIFYRF